MSKPSLSNNAPAQKERWLVYGLNMAVFLVAALAIVIFANWIVVKKLDSVSWLRWDMTATSQYSLSEQTNKVLQSLESPVQIIAMFNQGKQASITTLEQQRQIRDLLNEYDRRGSDKLTIEEFDPILNVAQFDQFTTDFRKRHQQQLDKQQQAIELALKTFANIRLFAQRQNETFDSKKNALAKSLPQVQNLFKQLDRTLKTAPQQLKLDSIEQAVVQGQRSPLPDYTDASGALADPLYRFKTSLVELAIKQFVALQKDQGISDEMKNFILARKTDFQSMLVQLNQSLALLVPITDDEYERIRTRIASSNCLLIMTEKRVSALSLDEVYIQPVAQPGQPNPDRRFRGEEAITGAIVSLTMPQKPLALFINTARKSAINRGGNYHNVAQMLRNMNFEVNEWNPSDLMTAQGPAPSQPMPKPQPGQTMVLIALPALPPSPQMPFNPAVPKMIEAVRKHLDNNQPTLIFATVSPMARFGQLDPMVDLLSPFAIVPRSDRIVLQAVPTPEGNIQPNPILNITSWPGEHPIVKALQGLPGINVQAIALNLLDTNSDKIKHWPLVQTPKNTWLEDDLDGSELPTQDRNDPTGPFTTAVAAEKNKARLIVIGDATWATDQITTLGAPAASGKGVMFTQYPANAELFVNSVFWLANMDQLIATSARTQDTRRYDPITPKQKLLVQLVVLLVMPAICIVAGVAIWAIRRK